VAQDISTGKEKDGNSGEIDSILAKARSWEKANLTICLLLAKIAKKMRAVISIQ
jgi:hypothetical protein